MSYDASLTDIQIEDAYQAAKDRYAVIGVDTEAALERTATLPISLHCWQ